MKSQVLVQTPKKNFTRTNLSEFFMAYEEPNFAMMVEVSGKRFLRILFNFVGIFLPQDTKGLLQGLPPPEVEVFCAHGSQVGRLPAQKSSSSLRHQHCCVYFHQNLQVPTTEKLVYPEGSFPPGSASWWSSGPTLIKVII